MRTLFEITYGLLWGVAVLEALVLRHVLREALWFKRLYSSVASGARPDQLPTGSPLPHFVAPVLGTGGTLTAADLKGRSAILLFVSPHEADSLLYATTTATMHALWHRARGHLFVICSGGAEPCRQLVCDRSLERFADHVVPVILDERGSIAASFRISSTPHAVILDGEGRVSRHGHPLPAEEAGASAPAQGNH